MYTVYCGETDIWCEAVGVQVETLEMAIALATEWIADGENAYIEDASGEVIDF